MSDDREDNPKLAELIEEMEHPKEGRVVINIGDVVIAQDEDDVEKCAALANSILNQISLVCALAEIPQALAFAYVKAAAAYNFRHHLEEFFEASDQDASKIPDVMEAMDKMIMAAMRLESDEDEVH